MAAIIHPECVEDASPQEIIEEDPIAERIAIESGMRATPALLVPRGGTYPKAARAIARPRQCQERAILTIW
jgi:hypothetical protein